MKKLSNKVIDERINVLLIALNKDQKELGKVRQRAKPSKSTLRKLKADINLRQTQIQLHVRNMLNRSGIDVKLISLFAEISHFTLLGFERGYLKITVRNALTIWEVLKNFKQLKSDYETKHKPIRLCKTTSIAQMKLKTPLLR